MSARINESNNVRVLSLFSGCGGLDLGFEGDFDVLSKSVNTNINPSWISESASTDMWVRLPKTKFNTVFANDIKPEAKTTWANYFSRRRSTSSIYNCNSIVDLVKEYDSSNIVFPENVDIVTGGFPCQDFSVAGKRKGFYSDKDHNGIQNGNNTPTYENRGQLYMWMRDVISITKPKLFIAENVKGLTNLTDVKSIIENDFRSIGGDGYLVIDARVLHAADYGVPQSRERVIFIGFKKSALTMKAFNELSEYIINPEYDPYPLQTHEYNRNEVSLFNCHNNADSDKLLPPVNLLSAFEGLAEPEQSDDISQQLYSKAKFMGKHCQGQTEVNLHGIGPTIRSEHHGNIEYRRLSIENGGKYHEEFNLGMKERRLTVRECARIQTFPDDYEFVLPANGSEKGVSASTAYKLVGNAVPPLLGFHIAKRLEDNWNLYFGGVKQ